MKFAYRYYGQSTVNNSASSTDMRFAPDTLRAPTHFVADLNRHLPFREAISALHDVVVADQRYQPRDNSAYLAWLQREEGTLLAQFMAQSVELRQKIDPLQKALKSVRQQKAQIMAPFYQAQRKYFDYLYQQHRDLWYVLDPVITVHPDRLLFECFSRDESSYASLSCSHNVFDRIGDFACGTTNIDYSEGLYGEFQKIRDYKTTRLAIDPGGFQVQSADDPAFVEPKIDVPESWVRGFLQVSSAMNLPAQRFDLQPMDMHNFLFILKRKKERVGPRSIRFVLQPGQPVRAIFEPWNQELLCRRSIYHGPVASEVRVWGRRRLLLLERLIARAEKFSVHLMGTGLPSFWIANLPDMQFTLGLSGWTANDWSHCGQFDLLAPRGQADSDSMARVWAALAQRWQATAAQLAQDTGLETALVETVLTLYTQAGRVIYDLSQGQYLLRELTREPLPLDTLRFASEQEEQAAKLVALRCISAKQRSVAPDGSVMLGGRAKDGSQQYLVSIRLDADARMVDARCECSFYIRNKLQRGPCQHMLALRMLEAQ